jgi:hypothetical protein
MRLDHLPSGSSTVEHQHCDGLEDDNAEYEALGVRALPLSSGTKSWARSRE